MAVVCSEVGEDYFLQSIGNNLFSDETEERKDTNDEYAETTFSLGDVGSPPLEDITIEHRLASTVALVGTQVWRGALLLGDYILAKPNILKDKRVVELAAGTGLTACVAANIARQVIATDVDRGDILPLLQANVKRNCAHVKATVCVQELDFFWDAWPQSLAQNVLNSEVVLAADVVYDRDITKHFFKTLLKILESPKLAFLAIEKRLSDPRDSKDVFASNFAYFKKNLGDMDGRILDSGVRLEVNQVNTDFRQFFQYTRVPQLTLWSVQSKQIS